jgi:hypothetical protein
MKRPLPCLPWRPFCVILLAQAVFSVASAQTTTLQITAGAATVNAVATIDSNLPPPADGEAVEIPYAQRDDDGDGLTNDQELKLGSNPLLADEDADGLSDSEENQRGSDPAMEDTDGDGTLDGEDGWPRHDWLNMPPLPRTEYAVLPLRQMGLPAEAYLDHYSALNDRCHILAHYPNNNRSVFFNCATFSSTDLPEGFYANNYYGYGYGLWGWWGWWGDDYSYYNHWGYGGYWYSRRLSDDGTVIGVMRDENNNLRAAKWREDSRAELLDGNYSSPVAINSAGDILGVRMDQEQLANGTDRRYGGVIWGGGGWLRGESILNRYRYYPSYSDTYRGTAFYPSDINDEGVVGGSRLTVDRIYDVNSRKWSGSISSHAALIEDGTVQNLGDGFVISVSDSEPTVVFGQTPTPTGYWNNPWWARKEDGAWVREPIQDIWNPSTLSEWNPSTYSWYRRPSFNKRFEMIVDHNRLLRNGVVEPVTMPPNWVLTWLADINNHGVILANAVQTSDSEGEPIPSSERKYEPVLLMPLSVDYISRNPFNGDFSSLGRLIAETSPAPSVDLRVSAVSLSNGSLNFTVNISIRDTLGELNASNLQSVKIFFDGTLRETVTLGNPTGETDPIWAPNKRTWAVTKNYTIANASPSGHSIRVQTSENTLGNIGWDQATILLKKTRVGFSGTPQDATSIGELPAIELQLPALFSTSANDSVVAEVDGALVTLTESTANSYIFSGLSVDGRQISFHLNSAPAYSTGVDELTAMLVLATANGVKQFLGSFIEDAPVSHNFSPHLIYYNNDTRESNLEVVGVVNGAESPSADIEPFVARITVQAAIAERFAEGGALRVELGGETVSLVRNDSFIEGDPASSGWAHFFVAKENSPRVFAAVEQLPELCLGADFSTHTLPLEIIHSANGSDVGIYDATASFIQLSDTGEQGQTSASSFAIAPPPNPATSSQRAYSLLKLPSSQASAQSNAYSLEEVLIWYEILFGEYGMQVLKVYQDLGPAVLQIQIADLNDASDWDDYEIDNWTRLDESNGLPCLVLIDNDQKSPVQAAMSLYYALHELENPLGRSDVLLAQFEQALSRAIAADGGNAETWTKLSNFQMEAVGGALQTCYDAGAMGISIVNEGASWTLTINDASEEWKQGARWTAAGMVALELVPFVSGRLAKNGKSLLIKRVINGQEFLLTPEVCEAIGKFPEIQRELQETLDALPNADFAAKNSVKVAARLRMMDLLSPLIRSGNVSPSLVESLHNEGFLLLDKGVSRGGLRDNLTRVFGANPGAIYVAHHDLPLEFELIFLQAGFDPNSSGRLMQKSVHDPWSSRPGYRPGGPFNQMWREFLASPANRTYEKIAERLSQVRSGTPFQVTNAEGVVETFTFGGGKIPLP